MPSRLALVAALALCRAFDTDAWAQETIFNVPSPDVLGRGKLYLETDQYFRSWKTASDRAALFLVRGVFGVGHNVEVGFNLGAFDYVRASEPFLDASVKWRPLSTGTIGVLVGDDAGIGLNAGTSGDSRSLAYTSGFVTAPGWTTRASGGPYCATSNVFGVRGAGDG